MKRRRNIRIAVWAGVIVAVGLIVWIATRGGGDSSSATTSAEIVTLEELRETAASQGTPIYWAGEQTGTRLELSQPAAGRTFVRYLPEGTEAGDPRVEFLTVGTYAFRDAVNALKELGGKPGGVLRSVPGGGTAYFSRNRPQNVYIAYPDTDLQIEVYGPEPGQALNLVTSGRIVPVG